MAFQKSFIIKKKYCYYLTNMYFSNFSFLKYSSNLKINTFEIINQKTDKFSLNQGVINYNDLFNYNDLYKILIHGNLKTNYTMSFFKNNSIKLDTINFSTFHTFTSQKKTLCLDNFYLGQQINNFTKPQLINLNKSLYTENNDCINSINDPFYTKFYEHYLKNTKIGNDLNGVLLDKFYKYQECLNLINVEYKSSCIQAVNVFYLKGEYLFEVNTLIENII